MQSDFTDDDFDPTDANLPHPADPVPIPPVEESIDLGDSDEPAADDVHSADVMSVAFLTTYFTAIDRVEEMTRQLLACPGCPLRRDDLAIMAYVTGNVGSLLEDQVGGELGEQIGVARGKAGTILGILLRDGKGPQLPRELARKVGPWFDGKATFTDEEVAVMKALLAEAAA